MAPSFEKKVVKGLYSICFTQIVLGYYFPDDVGGATILTNLTHT